MQKYDKYIESAYSRFEKWKADDDCVVFPIITDLHSALVSEDVLNSQKRETLSHIRILNAAAERFSADFTANLGDFGVDVPVKEPQDIEQLCSRLFEYHASSKVKPVLYAPGNHDITRGVVPAFMRRGFQEINAGCDILSPEDKLYGYYDIHAKKCRVFYLFCNETADYYSAEQFTFIEENLFSMPSGWCAVFVQHKCILRRGRWQHDQFDPLPENFVKLHELFANFVRNGGKIAGIFSGDSHFNLFEKADGVNYHSSQGYGGIGPSEAPAHALLAHEFCPALNRTDSFNSENSCLIDVAAVKTGKCEIAVFRIGAGDKEFDITENY